MENLHKISGIMLIVSIVNIVALLIFIWVRMMITHDMGISEFVEIYWIPPTIIIAAIFDPIYFLT